MAIPNTATTFPKLHVKDSKKDEDWHKQYVTAIAGDGLNDSFVDSNYAMDLSYRYYNGDSLGDEYEFVQEAEDGEVFPAIWNNMNRIKSRVDVVLGGYMKQGYEIKAEGINEEIQSKKLQYKTDLKTDMAMQPYAAELEQDLGMPLQPPYPVPENTDELEEMVKNYKEISETVMESALRFVAKMNNWDLLREMVIRDIMIAGRAIVRTRIRNGRPFNTRIDPRLFIFDSNVTNDDATDATYFGEIEYMPISEAAEVFNLSNKELQTAYEQSQRLRNGKPAKTGDSSFDALVKTSPVQFFDTDSGELRVLVMRAVWKDTKTLKYKKSKDKYDNIHIKQLRPSDRDKDATTKRIEIWRKGTLVAGKFMKDWGELENRPTDMNTMSETLPPYTIVLPNYINYRTVSRVEQLQALQDFKNLVWYNIQKEFSRAGGKGFVYDIAQIPEGWDEAKVIKYLKTAGIAFINSQVNGMPSNFNQFGQVDMTLSGAVGQYLDVNMRIDSEMDAISGINEARQGMVSGASQAVGVTQAALMQSDTNTYTMFRAVDRLFSRVLTLNARLIKLTWDKPERYSPIIGDAGVNFITQDIGLDLNDYAVFIEQTPLVFDDEQTYSQLITAAVQAGGIGFDDAMELLTEKNPREGLMKLRKNLAKKQMEAMQQQQQQMEAQAQQQQAQAQAQMQTAQMQQQGKQAVQDSVNQTELMTNQMDNKRMRDLSMVNAKTKLRSEGLKAMSKSQSTPKKEES